MITTEEFTLELGDDENSQVRLLFSDNQSDLIEKICQVISSFGYKIQSHYMEDFNIEDPLLGQTWDLILVFDLEGSTNFNKMIEKVTLQKKEIPWVVITNKVKKEEAFKLLNLGCSDIIKLEELNRLDILTYRILEERKNEQFNKRINEELLKENQRLSCILGSIGDGVITVDNEERIIMMNACAEKITGWSSQIAKECQLNNIFNVIDKASGRQLKDILNSTLKDGEIKGLQRNTLLISKEGIKKYISASLSPIKNSEDIIGAVIVFRDITRIRQTEEKLITEQQNLSLIFDTAPIGMLLIDENTVVKKVNKAMQGIIGKNENELIDRKIGDGLGCINSYHVNGCGFSEVCGKCELHKILIELSDIKKPIQGIEIDYTLFEKNIKKKLWLKVNSVPLTIEGQKHTILVLDEITKMKMAEEGLKRYQLLSENANDSIMFSTMEGQIIDANSAALHTYGYSKCEIRKKSVFDLISIDKKLLPVEVGNTAQKSMYYEALGKRKDGSTLPVEVSWQCSEIGNTKVLLSIQRDITERKQAQQELEKARESAEAANLAKSEFLANMSHEIRTPLNGMLGMIDLTLVSGLNEEQKDNLFIAKGCASNLLNLINDILDFSKIEARKLTMENIEFNLQELIEETIKPHSIHAAEKNLVLEFYFDADIPLILKGDQYRLRQVVNNLLANAVKFTENGKICFSTELKHRFEDYVELEFRVRDTGVGIDTKDLDKIFDTFSQGDSSITRKYGGSGLGLAISKQLVEMMGGTISVDSEKGIGSTFYFAIKLPIAKERTSLKKEVEAIVKTKDPLQILLAEDDKVNQIVIKRMVKEAGHFVVTVNNGIEAIKAIKEMNIDIVLMDIQMPKMDGLEAVKVIREKERATGKHIPIIALTAYALQGDKEKYLSAGMDDYIAKPVQMNDLLKTIEDMGKKSKAQNSLDKAATYFNLPDLKNDFSFQREKIVNVLEKKLQVLKVAFDNEDLESIEKYAHEAKKLFSSANMMSMKVAMFKLELAVRRENINEARGRFESIYRDFIVTKSES